jgi:hypothetical protein
MFSLFEEEAQKLINKLEFSIGILAKFWGLFDEPITIVQSDLGGDKKSKSGRRRTKK